MKESTLLTFVESERPLYKPCERLLKLAKELDFLMLSIVNVRSRRAHEIGSRGEI